MTTSNRIMGILLEGIVFLLTVIVLFNEFTTILQTFGLFTNAVMKHIGFISGLLGLQNVFSRTFFGVEIR